MNILVLSDTHSNVSVALKVIRRHGNFDCFFHLGDTYRDAQQIHSSTGLAMHAVSGNMDDQRVGPLTEVFELGGHRLLLTHGDQFGVHRSLIGLNLAAEEAGANIVCFGHTHRPLNGSVGARRFFNPGSLRGESGTYGILVLDASGVSFDVYPAAR